MLEIDKKIVNEYFLKKSNIFKHIHPNFISCLSILLNILIVIAVIKKQNVCIVLFLLFLRWLTDCLDGAIARKYNKTSKLGGKLDTSGDILFFYVLFPFTVVYLKTKNLYLSVLLSLITLIIGVTHFIYSDIESNHDNIKAKSDNYFKNLLAFLTNNSIFVFIIIGIAYTIYKVFN